MKYIAFYKGEFKEFNKWSDLEYYMIDKTNVRYKKVLSKKEEDAFRDYCLNAPEFIQKIYIVICDNKVYRFDKWKEAKILIDKEPNSKYKSFEKEEDAQDFINLNIHNNLSFNSLICKVEENNAYLIKENKEIWKQKIIDTNNQIFTELNGVLLGIKKAIDMKEEHIVILYNNIGTEMWANGTWNAKKQSSINYVKTINEYKKQINIDFVKKS